MENNTLPQFFADHIDGLPGVMKWTFDKLTECKPDSMDCDGRAVTVRRWTFQGSFARKQKNFMAQWNDPANGCQFVASVNTWGGTYRGQKQGVAVCFTQYSSKDGEPLPI